MKILLLGANGQLGRTFVDHGGLAARGELVLASRDGVIFNGIQGELADLSAPASLCGLFDHLQPNIIINAAAYTTVDKAEHEETLATRINGDSVRAIAAWAASHGTMVIHYSTDYIFDGREPGPYAVDKLPNPLNAYGRSKLAAEQALRASGAEHLIFRTAWVYAKYGHNFLRTMLHQGSQGGVLRVVADQHGTPTDTGLIVDGTLAALDRWQLSDVPQRRALAGTHHLVASGATTWYGFANAIFEQAVVHGLLTKAPCILPIRSNEFPTPTIRPTWSLLDNTGFQQHFKTPLADWRKGLTKVIQQLALAGH